DAVDDARARRIVSRELQVLRGVGYPVQIHQIETSAVAMQHLLDGGIEGKMTARYASSFEGGARRLIGRHCGRRNEGNLVAQGSQGAHVRKNGVRSGVALGGWYQLVDYHGAL